MIMAARCPDRVHSLVTWGAYAFLTHHDVDVHEKIRNIDNWHEAIRQPYIEVYGDDYLRTQHDLWVDKINAIMNKFDGNMFFYSFTVFL